MQEPHPAGEDSECARLVARKDWAATPLGPVEAWPQSLRTSLSICLACDFPILLWWGPDKVMLYNDEYIPVLGKKHPAAMGGLGHEVWADVWSVVGPMLEQVTATGKAVKAEDLLLLMNRLGYDEEAYFSFSYSPIADESAGVGGIFTPVIETTEKVIGQRRIEHLRRLGSLGRADDLVQACHALAHSLSEAVEDLPFGLLYTIAPDGAAATLACAFGLDGYPDAAPAQIGPGDEAPAWPVFAAAHAPAMQVVDGLDRRGLALPRGSWGAAVSQAVAIPITLPGQEVATVVLVAAVSPHRALDEVYLSFYKLLADQVHGIVSSALSNEAERKRAEALAQIDRAKTTFFSNVSHEFRTPLTLMLGPLAEIQAEPGLPDPVRERLQLVERNGMRMLKLVNGLLDFSRIEAGRMVAHFEPVDLAQLTGELAAVFRSAVERAGLRYEVECAQLPEPVYVDRAMWEKIVLNLLSNAFKYTFEGRIAVRVRVRAGVAELSVSDTGVGVAEGDLSRVFERFHRIEGGRSRSHEGSGIGLALVRDLAELHGGQARIDSRLGEGTTVSVSVPLGRAHLPADQVEERADWQQARQAHSIQAGAHMAEADLWLGGARDEPLSTAFAPTAASGVTVFVVDDNADMRDYVAGLLAPAHTVLRFADGAQALEAARRARPALIVSDVMMPVMDGYALLGALKADRQLANLPVLLLSARAGEEERIGAARAGADDYLEKPFSSRELLAKVDALLLRTRIRELEMAQSDRIDTIFRQAPVAIALLRGPDLVFELANPHYLEVVGGRQVLGQPIRQAVPELVQQGICAQLDEVYLSGKPRVANALRVDLLRGAPPALQERFFNLVYQPTFGGEGAVDGVAVVAVDVTDTVLARRGAETANRAKDEFMAMLGHELRNPLAPIMTALEVMRLRGIQTVQKEHGIIERQARHLVGLVNDLLDVARISRGKVALRREPTELAALVAHAVETASPLLEGRQHILKLQVPKDGLAVDADRQRMGQVIANLLTNAAKYSDTGSTITVRGRREAGEVVLEVSDTGRGIAPDRLPHLFDMFYQDPQSLSRSQGGLGLGLAIVRSLTELHGGRVAAASAGPMRGATFTVRLPAAGVDGAAGMGAGPARTAAPADARAELPAVLVVDDNEDAAEMLAALLGSVGYGVDTAGDGPSALRKLDGAWPAIAILDIGLPGMDGYELAGRIRQLAAARGRAIKLVALSGYGQDSDVRRALAAGFDRHIAKPVSLATLQDMFGTLAEPRQPHAAPG